MQGVKINCEHPVTRESINCKTEKVPTGTTAFYKCEDYYVSNNGDGDEGGQIKCNNNGEWTPRNSLHGFSCRIGNLQRVHATHTVLIEGVFQLLQIVASREK